MQFQKALNKDSLSRSFFNFLINEMLTKCLNAQINNKNKYLHENLQESSSPTIKFRLLKDLNSVVRNFSDGL